MQQQLYDDIEKMKTGIQEGIDDAESAEESSYGAFDGQQLSKSGGNHTYQFTLRVYWDIDDNAKISVVDSVHKKERKINVDARVLSRETNTIMIVTRAPLPLEELTHTFFIEDKTWFLKRQLQKLSNFTETPAEFGAKTLGLAPVKSETKALRGTFGTFMPHPRQAQAIAHGLGSEKTLIVGPPGTGKTTTISDLICRYLRQGLSVLLVSHTNIATDNAFMRLIQAMQESKKEDLRLLIEQGLVVRVGDPRHVALRTGDYRGLTVNAQAEARMSKQIEACEELEKVLSYLIKQIESLEQKASEQKEAWKPRREVLNGKMNPLEAERATLQVKVDEQERKDQEFLATKAEERQKVEEVLALLQKQQKELLDSRLLWINEAAQRKKAWQDAVQAVSRIRAMSRVVRFFSEYHNYDFTAADTEVAGLLKRKEQADATIIEMDRLLTENASTQIPPKAEIFHIERDVQGFYTVKKVSGNINQQRIKYLKKQLAPLLQEVQQGEQQVAKTDAEVASLAEERDRIKAQIEDLKAQQESLKAQIVMDAHLVSTTITSAYLTQALLERSFDVVVVDELSMISVIGVLLVASRAMKHFVGAGDPMQLSPVVVLKDEKKSPHAKEWLGKNLFTYLGVNIFDAIHGEKECCLLTEHGRSSPSIMAPINHFIYQDMLTFREETMHAPAISPRPDNQLLFIDTTGTSAKCIKPSKTKPRENEYHASLAVMLARQVLESLPPRPRGDDPTIPRVAIVVPYRSQVRLVQKKLRETKFASDVHVGTINTVQSLEFPVVIFDTVEAPGISPSSFTFDTVLDDHQMATEATRRLNVAWTRARHKLIVIAHRKHLHNCLPRYREEYPVQKQRLLVDLVDWAYREGHINAAEVMI